MTAESSNRDRTAVYRTVHRAISALLYERDPWGMGSTIGAPDDEYDDAAARLIPALLRQEGVTSVYPDMSDLPADLVERLHGTVEPLRGGLK